MDVLFLLVGLLAGVNGNHLYDDINAEYEEIVKLERQNGDGRLRRQGLDFPHTLEYSFNLEQKKKSLRLKRNTYVRDYVPLTLRTKGVNKRLTGYEAEFSKSAYYLDDESGAAVFLHCEDFNEDCSMYGIFHDKGEKYTVHPSENGFHRIKRAAPETIDMSNDVPEEIDQSRIEKAMAFKHRAGIRNGVVEEHTVEISFFLDDRVYSFFLDKYNGNPTLALKWLLRYYVQAANEMHLRYRSVQETHPYFKINILLNEVVVSKELSDCPWIEENLYSPDEVKITARDSFARWQNDNKDNYTQYDHALAITKRILVYGSGSPGVIDLYLEHDKKAYDKRDDVTFPVLWCYMSQYITYSTACTSFQPFLQKMLLLTSRLHQGFVEGITYFDGVCLNPEIAVSISMDIYPGHVGDLLAHELGHNIGAYHDGTVGCDDINMRVMGAYIFPPIPRTTFNSWFFSDCSIRQFMYYFNKKVGKPSCTMDTLGEGASLEDQLKVPPGGETYSLDEQCQFSFGSDSYFIKPVGNHICKWGIPCHYPARNSTRRIYTFYHTTCGKRKWCDHGNCVPRVKLPPH